MIVSAIFPGVSEISTTIASAGSSSVSNGLLQQALIEKVAGALREALRNQRRRSFQIHQFDLCRVDGQQIPVWPV
jgi:hypothetical protein